MPERPPIPRSLTVNVSERQKRVSLDDLREVLPVAWDGAGQNSTGTYFSFYIDPVAKESEIAEILKNIFNAESCEVTDNRDAQQSWEAEVTL